MHRLQLHSAESGTLTCLARNKYLIGTQSDCASIGGGSYLLARLWRRRGGARYLLTGNDVDFPRAGGRLW